MAVRQPFHSLFPTKNSREKIRLVQPQLKKRSATGVETSIEQSGRAFPVVSFGYTPVECLFYKFYGINCRAKSSAKLFDRFFHRRRQVSPVVKYLTHCFFDGSYHLLDGDVAVGFHHGLASHFGAPAHGGGWHVVGQRIRETSVPEWIVSSVSFVHHEHGKELGRPRVAGIEADAEASVLDKESYTLGASRAR